MSNILIFGHKNPDTDTIASAIAFSDLQNKRGFETEAVALGEPSEEATFALEYFNFEAPRVVKTVANEVDAVMLVDHNEFQQSVDDIADVQVLAVVDHHKIANFETSGPVFYRAEPIGSTASIIYKLYNENQIEIPKDIAGLMLSAIVSDTLLLKSPTTTEEDKAAADHLAEIAGVQLESYGLELLRAGADVSRLTEEEILEGDAKSFEMGEHAVRIGQVNVVDEKDVLSRKEALLEKMEELVVENTYGLYLLVVTNIITNDSIGLVVGSEESLSFVEAAYNKKIKDNTVELAGVVSRKKQIVPPLTDAFEK